MAKYSELRTMKALPIGSVQPWVGPLTRIPKGWLLCNGAELNSEDYPLLARILKDSYGGTNFGGSFPNYTGTFRLPPTNQRGLADIDVQYFSDDTTTEVNGETVKRPAPIDNLEALTVLTVENDFIAEDGDGSLSAPTVVFATTDLLFSYTPDPDGFVAGVQIDFANSGPPPYTAETTVFSNVEATGGSAGVNDVKATFKVVIGAGDEDGVTPGPIEIRRENGGEGYAAGDSLTIPGASFSSIGGVTGVNDLIITVTSVGDGFFNGSISGQSIINGFDIRPVYVIGRKLSRQHFPQHYHGGQYRTINKGDSTSTPGRGAGIYQNAEIDVVEYWTWERGYNGALGQDDTTTIPELHSIGNAWSGAWQVLEGSGESNQQKTVNLDSPFEPGVGRYALAVVDGSDDIPKNNKLNNTQSSSHGVGKDWFKRPWGGANLRDGQGSSTPDNQKLQHLLEYGEFLIDVRIPFSDDVELIKTPNYDGGGNNRGDSEGIQGFTEVLYNTAGNNYNVETASDPSVNNVILPHDHNGSFNIIYDDSGLTLKPSINVRVRPEVVPDDIENAFQITYNVPSPSLAIIHLIRAY